MALDRDDQRDIANQGGGVGGVAANNSGGTDTSGTGRGGYQGSTSSGGTSISGGSSSSSSGGGWGSGSANAATGPSNYGGGPSGSSGNDRDDRGGMYNSGYGNAAPEPSGGFQSPENNNALAALNHLDRTLVDTGYEIHNRYPDQVKSPGEGMVIASDIAKTMYGELGPQYMTPENSAYIGTTIMNRANIMATGKKTYGKTFKEILDKGYDVRGATPRQPVAGSAYTSAKPGVAGYDQAVDVLGSLFGMGAPPPDIPPEVQNATHYFNPEVSDPDWGKTGFTQFGPHTFGNATPAYSGDVVADARNQIMGGGGQTQVAGGEPAQAVEPGGIQPASFEQNQPMVGNTPEAQQAIADDIAQMAGIGTSAPIAATGVPTPQAKPLGTIGKPGTTGSPVPTGMALPALDILEGIFGSPEPPTMQSTPFQGATLSPVQGASLMGTTPAVDTLMGTTPPATTMAGTEVRSRSPFSSTASQDPEDIGNLYSDLYGQAGLPGYDTAQLGNLYEETEPKDPARLKSEDRLTPEENERVIASQNLPDFGDTGRIRAAQLSNPDFGQSTFTAPALGEIPTNMPQPGEDYDRIAKKFGDWGVGRPHPAPPETVEASGEPGAWDDIIDAAKSKIASVTPDMSGVKKAMNNPHITQMLASLLSGKPGDFKSEPGGTDTAGFDIEKFLELLLGAQGGTQLAGLRNAQQVG